MRIILSNFSARDTFVRGFKAREFFYFPFTLSIRNKYRDIGANCRFIYIFLAPQTIEFNYDASVTTIVGLLLANASESGFQDYRASRKNITSCSEIRFRYVHNGCHIYVSSYITTNNNKERAWILTKIKEIKNCRTLQTS